MNGYIKVWLVRYFIGIFSKSHACDDKSLETVDRKIASINHEHAHHRQTANMISAKQQQQQHTHTQPFYQRERLSVTFWKVGAKRNATPKLNYMRHNKSVKKC